MCHSHRWTQWGGAELSPFSCQILLQSGHLQWFSQQLFINDVFLYDSAIFDVARISLFGSLVVEVSAFVPCWQSLKSLVLQSWMYSKVVLKSYPTSHKREYTTSNSLHLFFLIWADLQIYSWTKLLSWLTYSFNKYLLSILYETLGLQR